MSKFFLFFILLLICSCAVPPSTPSSSIKLENENRSGIENRQDRGALVGNVILDKTASATEYKVKLKRGESVIGETIRTAGGPFRFDELEPGTYDLVIEAKGHSTFVRPGFAAVAPKTETRTTVNMTKAPLMFPDGDATKIILCSACHKKIYMEMIRGEGTDLHTGPWPGPDGKVIELPDLARDFYHNSSPEHLAYVAPITVATIAKQPKEKQDACRTCHAPTLIHVGRERPAAPGLRENNRLDGVSCASCHLDQNGSVRGKYDLSAPHPTVQDPLFTPARSAELCAACHQADQLAPNQQTVSEWKTDFSKNDPRTCQDCHMPPVVRRLSEIFSDRPERAIGKHLFAGGHSTTMLKKAATLRIDQSGQDPGKLEIGITNSGAGHSLPTGHGPRAVLLHLKVTGPDGTSVIDSTREGPLAIYAVDPALGERSDRVHPAIRAGATEKTMVQLNAKPGRYTAEVMLFYDLDRLVDFNDHELPLIESAWKSFDLK
ncbi:MAG TPA: carboxypeptidase-like regulatory domain-containing protein [Candidatus Manganitrophaceae bacterium]|nr:carboxypeptidase-like regulatory domain-containing protein [Candidatus Manganitrophaceae bacterium]